MCEYLSKEPGIMKGVQIWKIKISRQLSGMKN